MQDCIEALLQLGKIPNDDDMPDELFRKYDNLLQAAEPVSFEEAEALVTLFSDDCYDLNDGLMRLIETADISQTARYRAAIAKCSSVEFREMLALRLNNYLKKNGTNPT